MSKTWVFLCKPGGGYRYLSPLLWQRLQRAETALVNRYPIGQRFLELRRLSKSTAASLELRFWQINHGPRPCLKPCTDSEASANQALLAHPDLEPVSSYIGSLFESESVSASRGSLHRVA